MADEFYVGYEGPPPPGMRRLVRRVVVAGLAVGLAAVAAATTLQRRLEPARFDFAAPTTVEGWLRLEPVPALLVPGGRGVTVWWLVGPGKWSADRALGDVRSGWVRLDGKIIERGSWHMLEVVPGTARAISPGTPPPASAPVAERSVRLTGELVDGKCYLGVMNPGERTVHRDCATRCLSGGVPAFFAFRDAAGARRLALVLGADGRPAGPRLASLAGTPVTLEGRLATTGGADVLIVAPMARPRP
ncbi:MAG: hypothetical protein AB1635_08580 [Acidobacteriota bacterium]